MSWQLGPVVRGIRGHRSAATLVAIQFGIGLAITVLAVLIADYFRQGRADGASSDDDLVVIELQLARPDAARVDAVFGQIETTPPCAGAVVAANVPLHSLEFDADEVRGPAGATTPSTAIGGGPGFAWVAGMTLRDGQDLGFRDRRPRHAGVKRPGTEAIVSPDLAEALWPGKSPLGMTFESRAFGPAEVIGVAEPTSRLFGEGPVAVYAHVASSAHVVILARSEPGRAGELQAALVQRLRAPGQHAEIRPAREHLLQFARPIGSVLAILAILVGTIMLVVLMGSMGLTYFLVSSRTREIGLRRAMGATRRDTIRYFLVENVIVTSAGVVVGLAIVLAILPVLAYEQKGFSTSWPLIGATTAAVCVLNLVATWIPARRAAAVPPVVASRST